MSPETYLLTLSVAFFMGSALSNFFMAFSRDIVMPILAALFGSSNERDVDKFYITIGDNKKLLVGDLLSSFFHIILAYFIVSMTLPYIRQFSPTISTGGRK
jgi:large-conductance mechanosensitive channel